MSGAPGLQVTQSGIDPDLFYLTFAKHSIDAAIVGDVPAPADPSIGWDVFFGALVLDRTTGVVEGTFSVYNLSVASGADTLDVLDGATPRLTGDVVLGKLYVKQNGLFGGMDGTLTNLTVDDGGSAAFADFAAQSPLQWGFAYSGLDLQAYLANPPAQAGYAASSGYIQVPEPATIGLIGIGLVTALVARRRR
ncbi:MAG TPA: PEP-CTERM sorting domain-containing protein [Phycisphaerae bacterium]|nr:PEP-CTERM sorting domain-containing protein [Phycisphaerae bacterium]